jgi:hypothetical protein
VKKLHSIITTIAMLTITIVASGENSKWYSIFSLFDYDDGNEAQPVAWNNITTSNYNAIYVGNDVNLLINPKHKHKPNILVQGPDIKAYVKNNTLYLKGNCISTTNCNKNHNAYIKDISNIKYIHTVYNAKVYSKNLERYNTAMTIYSEDNSSVVLEGIMNIKEIKHDSAAVSKVLWLDAKDTSISAQKGFLRMAGVANNVNIRAHNKAYVDAAQLRAKNSWVSTTDRATVSIGALSYLYAHSENNSMIRYPEFLRDTVFITKDNSKIINTKLDIVYAAKK